MGQNSKVSCGVNFRGIFFFNIFPLNGNGLSSPPTLGAQSTLHQGATPPRMFSFIHQCGRHWRPEGFSVLLKDSCVHLQLYWNCQTFYYKMAHSIICTSVAPKKYDTLFWSWPLFYLLVLLLTNLNCGKIHYLAFGCYMVMVAYNAIPDKNHWSKVWTNVLQ